MMRTVVIVVDGSRRVGGRKSGGAVRMGRCAWGGVHGAVPVPPLWRETRLCCGDQNGALNTVRRKRGVDEGRSA